MSLVNHFMMGVHIGVCATWIICVKKCQPSVDVQLAVEADCRTTVDRKALACQRQVHAELLQSVAKHQAILMHGLTLARGC